MKEVYEQLATLGLTQLEAEVYVDLWKNGSATGYAIGKRIGKQTANVYKATESLHERGAILIEEGKRNRRCRAVPPAEFLAQLQRTLQAKQQQALASLQGIKSTVESDEKVYRLDSAALVIERAIDMLNRCQSIAVLDAFPGPLTALSDTLADAAARGIKVIVQAYEPLDIKDAHLTIAQNAEFNLTLWQSQQINLVIDGTESLLALLNHDLSAVHQAVWSQSSYLSFMMHVGLVRENNAHQLLALESDEVDFERVQDVLALDARFHPNHVPGLQTLLLRHGTEAQS